MSQIPPFILFRSFLTVASGFLVAQFLLMAVMLALGYFFFHDYFQFAILDAEQREEILATQPDAGTPPVGLLISILLITGLCYLGLGYLVVRMAPLAGLAHAILVSLLLFVWLAQGFFNGDEDRKLFDFLYMLIFPISFFVGGHFADRRLREESHDTDTPS